jgi:hypothetical protein
MAHTIVQMLNIQGIHQTITKKYLEITYVNGISMPNTLHAELMSFVTTNSSQGLGFLVIFEYN